MDVIRLSGLVDVYKLFQDHTLATTQFQSCLLACFSISVSVMEHKGPSSSSAWFSFLSVLAVYLLDVDFEKVASFAIRACSITLRRIRYWHIGQTESGTHEKWKECPHPMNTRHLSPCTWQLWRSHSLLGSGWSSFFHWEVKGAWQYLICLGFGTKQKRKGPLLAFSRCGKFGQGAVWLADDIEENRL